MKQNLFLCIMLFSSVALHADFCPDATCAQECGRSCRSADDLSQFSANNDAYTRVKQVFSGDDSTKLSLEDLAQTLLIAKESGDDTTYQEACSRIKIQLATEDEGGTIVLRVKELGVPVAITTAVVSVAAYFMHNYVNQRNGNVNSSE